MRVGTRSLLFGEHQLVLHPLYVASAWRHLFGFPWDPRLWLCFFLHDIGYWGRPDMDGESGREHPRLGALAVHRLLDRGPDHTWMDFCLYHSRYLADKGNRPVSRLALADKFSLVLMPWWLWLALAWLSGSLGEYARVYAKPASIGYREWIGAFHDRTRDWVVLAFQTPAGIPGYYWSGRKNGSVAPDQVRQG